MLPLLIALLRALLFTRKHLALENIVLRQQLAVLERSILRALVRWCERTACGARRGFKPSSSDSVSAQRSPPPEGYMTRRRGPPSGKWPAFLKNHAGEILACDFFSVPTASFKTLIGFVVIELGRRLVVACDVTEHPTASWAAGIISRAMLAVGRRAKHLVRDRDAICAEPFKVVMKSLGLRQMVSAYHAPLQNAPAERVIGTLRCECVDHVIVMGGRHARAILDEYVEYYNADRTHQALGAGLTDAAR